MYSKVIYLLNFFVALVAVSVAGQNLYDYTTETCCNGAVFKTANSTANSNWQCCGKQYVNIKQNQTCCNNAVVNIPKALLKSGSYDCCGSQVYSYSNSICCNNTIKKNPKGSLSCCGSNTYDSSSQVCCSDTGKLLNIPKSNCPTSLYFSCCADQLIGPNQQCCNGVTINPSTTLIIDPSGGYNYTATSFCCSGGGIVQNPNKEACCGNGVIASNGPNSACCGGVAYDSSSQLCCGNKLFSTSNYGLSCCGNDLYDYTSQICCNNVALPQNSSLSCCYSYDDNPPVPIINRK